MRKAKFKRTRTYRQLRKLLLEDVHCRYGHRITADLLSARSEALRAINFRLFLTAIMTIISIGAVCICVCIR